VTAVAQKADILDLARFAPAPGDGARLDVDVDPGSFEYGEQRYAVPGGTAPARVDVSRTAAGYALRLRFAAEVEGPCTRCLEGAELRIEVDAREVDQPGEGTEELSSPYVDGDELDLGAWSHDALALAMPEKFLCRADCAGLCPVCGESLNDADPAKHRHERGPDPRFAKLRELKLD
jgi:uncharacterized protein